MDLEEFADECAELTFDVGSKTKFLEIGKYILDECGELKETDVQVVAKAYYIGEEKVYGDVREELFGRR